MQSELECVVYSILQFTIAYENIHYNMLEYTGYIIIYHMIYLCSSWSTSI